MKQYLDLCKHILEDGYTAMDRTGTGTISLFAQRMEFDLRQGFPLITTKRIWWRAVVLELIWMLSGSSNARWLQERGITIWDEWASDNGNLGPVYGKQWRDVVSAGSPSGKVVHLDQLADLIDQIKHNPDSRRLIVDSWNVSELHAMHLPPCHCFFQCYVEGDYLDLFLHQRSADMFLGVPFNIASYSLLLIILAQLTGKRPRRFIHSLGNAHIYLNHIQQMRIQIAREPLPLPTVTLDPDITSLDQIISREDKCVHLEGYKHHPRIDGEVSV